MKILVTGSAGYLASHLIPELEGRGHTVFGVDHGEGDLTSEGVFKAILRQHADIDMVVHCAAQPGRLFGERDPKLTIDSNLMMTIEVARACGEAGVRLCFFSTSEVYGPHGRRFVTEDERLNPINLYGITKVAAEHVCHIYAPEGLIILRPSMAFSGDMPVGYGRAALPTFIWRALRGEEIVVHHETYRSWCYASDMASAMATVIEKGDGTYNVGHDENEDSMEHIAQIADVLSNTPNSLIRYEDPPPSVTPLKRLDFTRLYDLGWGPMISLRAGMALTAEKIKERMKPGGDLA